ncbi:ABC transporter ATP-binding protein [Natrarchaeobius halalkaliphilus]|uniref:ABC-type D-xylose/L-arabinose transporter n=1 Tax=Natrarchaeobius halalkaliphilus TaxID=1679091 RepID=A0A3N6LJ21_9EURY|nr:ABC transporter ATP-binding protein [Natrarchaeobius halalkaliphilus]RQG88036.1 ABC transporter ATP-binding protein [Natrarchaeobius halalkaliphilus]
MTSLETKQEVPETDVEPTIKIDNLRKEFDVPGGIEVAVDGVSLDIGDGEFVTLVGPSGCGKTTTLRCIAGLETPTSGQITHEGEDLTYIPANKRNMAMMFQNIALYPHMTIVDNIAYPLKVIGVPKSERHEEAREAAEIMQIGELLDKYPGELSGGQRQRAALARTLVQDPVAFLMDEPLSDLDAKLKVEIRKEIQKVHKRLEKSTVYVTHDQEEAMTMSDRIAVMNDGQIEQVGTRDELYNYPVNTFVASFIGNPSINYFDGNVLDLSEERGAIDVHGTTIEFDVEYFSDSLSGSDVRVGFRPIAVSLEMNSSGGQFEGSLELLEPVDDRALATVDGPEGELRAHIPTNLPLEEEETVQIEIDTTDLYIFDGETEELVARSR